MESCAVKLFGPVGFGHTFLIAGVAAIDCKNFKVVFCNEGEDIGLNILVDLTLKQIVINSFVGKKWSNPLKWHAELDPGQSFKFHIFVSEWKYHIALNSHHLAHYSFQSLPNKITNISVFGGLEQITQIDHRRVYPLPWPPIQEDIDGIAFSGDVPINFFPGSVIVLKMRVSGAPKGSFFIRFNEFSSKRQLFHFNPRFDEKVVVVNSMNDSLEWLEHEQRSTEFPFSLNMMFSLAIAMTSTSFKVAVDGKHFLTFDLKMIPVPLPSAFSPHHPIFDRLTGFKIFALRGMKAFVSEVKHVQLKEDCNSYECLSIKQCSQ